MTLAETVYVVDDDPGVLKSLDWLIRSVGLSVETFESGEAFLEAFDAERPACLLLDVRMPGMTGIEVQKALRSKGRELPVIFLTGHGDVSTASRAFRDGAFDFLEKPFDGHLLLGMVREAIAKDKAAQRERARSAVARERLRSLTGRELAVLQHVVDGMSSREIAALLGRSVNTVENQRACIMRKMETPNVASLTRLVLAAGLEEIARIVAERAAGRR
jgi:FixJ family two-component response regulator